MRKTSIVVLEDKEITLNAIVQQISSEYREIIPCLSYEDAADAIQTNTPDFFIADLQVENRLITRELYKLKGKYPDLAIIVVTAHEDQLAGIPPDTRILPKPIDWQALNYILSPPDYSAKELQRLKKQLTDTGDNYLLQIFEEMDIGISIVDPQRKVIYANRNQQEISGPIKKGEDCYKSFAPYAESFCEECPIISDTGRAIHVRGSGYYDMQRVTLRDKAGKTMAHIKIAQRVTDPTLLTDLHSRSQETDLRENILKIMAAIKAMSPANVRFFLVSEDGNHLVGYEALLDKDRRTPGGEAFKGQAIPLAGDYYSQNTFQSGTYQIYQRDPQKTDNHDQWGKYFKDENYWAEIPLYKNGKPVALITINYWYDIYPELAKSIPPALLEKIKSMEHQIVGAIDADLGMRKYRIDQMLIALDNAIYQQETTRGVLDTLIKGCINIIKHYWEHTYLPEEIEITGHIMVKQGHWLEKVAGEGIIFDRWHERWLLTRDHEAPCVQVVNSAQEIIWDDIHDDRFSRIFASCLEVSIAPEVMAYVEQVGSLCCLPVQVRGETIGVISIQSSKRFLFNEYIKRLLKTFVHKGSPWLTLLCRLDIGKAEVKSLMGLANVITHLFQEKNDEKRLIWAMLTGLTHEDGLRFNRAVYCEQVEGKVFEARFGVGPLNKEKAREIYESHQINTVSLQEAINYAEVTNQEFNKHLQGMVLPEEYFPAELRFHQTTHEISQYLPDASGYVSFKLALGAQLNTGIIVDNFYSGIIPTFESLNILKMAGEIFTLFMHNLVTKTYENELLSIIFHHLRTNIGAPLDALKLASARQDMTYLNIPLMKKKLWEVFTDTNDLLHYTRSKLERQAPKRTQVDLHPLVAELIDDFAFLKGISRIKNETSEKSQIFANKEMVKHSLLNLIDNAVKYSPARSDIVVRHQRTQGYDRILVMNQPSHSLAGVDLERLFDRFQKGPGSQGGGLGLYIVKVIAQAHGGKIVATWDGQQVMLGLALPHHQEEG